ncbi:ATP-binding protein [Roseateles sp. GG27B]
MLLLLITLVSLHFVHRAGRRRAEAQYALQVQRSRASRLESLGTLASGVAHDFNNVLTAILGFGEMAQDAAPAGSDQARQIDRMLQAALRGRALSSASLPSAAAARATRPCLNWHPSSRKCWRCCQLPAPGRGAGTGSGSPRRGTARRRDPSLRSGDELVHERAASNASGMLSLRLKRETVTAAPVLSHSRLVVGRYVALSVTDQGVGITPAVIEHLFEPFFTTRSAESGTGLGLAMVHGVVNEFGGAIDVQSQPGQGACFTLYLPESMAAANAATSPPAAPS